MGEASREFMRRARKQVPEWTPSQVQEALTEQSGSDDQEIVLLDVREKHEWNEGHIPVPFMSRVASSNCKLKRPYPISPKRSFSTVQVVCVRSWLAAPCSR